VTLEPKSPIRWGQRQRFAFLERRLFWEGSISRQDLMTQFDISAPQASADVMRYSELAPNSISFDRSLKTYTALAGFEPKFFEPNARHYLSQLLLKVDDALPKNEGWLTREPDHAVIPRVRRRMDTDTLRPIVMAIHQRRAVEIHYQSMSADEPAWRWIAPHALVYDGARWHARSWCFNRSVFNDFVLARMLAIRESRPSTSNPELDRLWHEQFVMELSPHPDLSPGRRQAIEMDYGMERGFIGIPMRLCLTAYFERQHGLDLPFEHLPPWRQQVILRNRSELEAVRATFGGVKEPS
jgi:hypothetical protein